MLFLSSTNDLLYFLFCSQVYVKRLVFIRNFRAYFSDVRHKTPNFTSFGQIYVVISCRFPFRPSRCSFSVDSPCRFRFRCTEPSCSFFFFHQTHLPFYEHGLVLDFVPFFSFLLLFSRFSWKNFPFFPLFLFFEFVDFFFFRA